MPGLVAAAGRHVDAVGSEPERAGAAVEQRAEHARAVEARQAQPLDRAVGRDQRAGVAVREEGVVGDRRERRLAPGGAARRCRRPLARAGRARWRRGLRRAGPGGSIAGWAALRARAYRGPRICGTSRAWRALEWETRPSERSPRVEASALPTRLTRGRAPLSAAVLRLRSDEQLVALFRAGSDDAFRAIHDRYRTRLLAYARQMLRGGARRPGGRAPGRVPARLPLAARAATDR